MPAPFRIREEDASDRDDVLAVTRAAFRDDPQGGATEVSIIDALRRAGAIALSLVAEVDGKVAGHVAFSPVMIEADIPVDGPAGDSGGADREEPGGDRLAGWYGLGPLSVQPSLQHQGLGSTLVEKGLAELRLRGARGCVVLGEPAYYRRFGFRSSPRLVAEGLPPEYFMFVAFDESASPSGTVFYHPAFFGSL